MFSREEMVGMPSRLCRFKRLISPSSDLVVRRVVDPGRLPARVWMMERS